MKSKLQQLIELDRKTEWTGSEQHRFQVLCDELVPKLLALAEAAEAYHAAETGLEHEKVAAKYIAALAALQEDTP